MAKGRGGVQCAPIDKHKLMHGINLAVTLSFGSSDCLCQGFVETFCLAVGLGLQWSDLSVSYATVDKTFPRLTVERTAIVGFDDLKIPIRTEDLVENWNYCLGGGTVQNFYHGEKRVLIDYHK